MRAEDLPKDTPKRRCARCKQVMDATPENFNRSVLNKDGFVSWCKPCVKKYNRERYEKKLNKLNESMVETRGRTVWTPGMREYSAEELAQLQYEHNIPEGYYECSKCGRVKKNTTQCFPLQPGRFRTPEGERKFSTVCRNCKRNARRGRKYKKEMQRAFHGYHQPTQAEIAEYSYNQGRIDNLW